MQRQVCYSPKHEALKPNQTSTKRFRLHVGHMVVVQMFGDGLIKLRFPGISMFAINHSIIETRKVYDNTQYFRLLTEWRPLLTIPSKNHSKKVSQANATYVAQSASQRPHDIILESQRKFQPTLPDPS